MRRAGSWVLFSSVSFISLQCFRGSIYSYGPAEAGSDG